jgi:hypothetical protein
MARWGDSDKRREWGERLARFARWDGTVAEFCEAERVSAPSFYQWRRKLAARGMNGAAGERRSRREGPQTFVPVQLVSAASATVDIELPNGAHVCLSAPDRQLLAAAIAAAGRVAVANGERSTSRGEGGRC